MLGLFVCRFISNNPLECDHATTYTLKHVLREKARLKAFDGHKIKCQKMMPLMTKETHKMDGKLNTWNPVINIQLLPNSRHAFLII